MPEEITEAEARDYVRQSKKTAEGRLSLEILNFTGEQEEHHDYDEEPEAFTHATLAAELNLLPGDVLETLTYLLRLQLVEQQSVPGVGHTWRMNEDGSVVDDVYTGRI